MSDQQVKKPKAPTLKTGRTVTSLDVAKAAGVSQSLVSLILSEKPGKKIRPETRTHVLKIASDMGYRPNMQASAMKLRKAQAIGLLSVWETGSFVFPPVVNGLKAVCDREGLALTICTGRTDAAGTPDYLSYFLQNRLDGIVYLSHVGVGRSGVIETLQRHQVPFVCAIGAKDLPEVSSVDVDFILNGRLAAEHLAEAGCRRPVIGIDPELNYAEQERMDGFLQACRDNGMHATCMIPWEAGGEPEAAKERLRRLLRENPDMDGFAAVTKMAWQMLEAARAEGIPVPERLKVISLDNEAYAPYLTPSLSTVDEPLETIGQTAGEMLVGLMAGDEAVRKRAEHPTLSRRSSSLHEI